VDTRSLILEKTAELLAQSATGEVSTRAVCEAAGVTQPVLYRLFGDKDGLLAATVDFVWEQYLSMKRAATKSPDPLADLRSGWDSHVAFALSHPHTYRLLFGTSLSTTPEAGAEAMRLLRVNLDRLAEQGRLRVAPDEAARLVMAANSGVALALLLRPHEYPDVSVSTVMRDVIHRAILAEEPGQADTGQARFVAATTLRGGMGDAGLFSAGEVTLLDEWLERIQVRHRPD
jgi:AcrR family transcriptional regulator